MPKWKTSLLIAIMTMAALAQTATDLESPAVNRVAAHLNCSCGCKLNMACRMPPDGRCPVCQMNKAKILAMQQAGSSDQQILDKYVAENGKDILVIPPGAAGVIGPYVVLGLGLIAVFFTIRRYMQRKPSVAAAEIDRATLDQIEKDLAKLD
jgi:cytochrome c-type biogenesis protein CcmH/NrfF